MASKCSGWGAGCCLFFLCLFIATNCPGASAWTHPAGRRGAARLLAGMTDQDGAELSFGPSLDAQGQDVARGRRGSSTRGWRGLAGGPTGAFLGLPSPPSPPSPSLPGGLPGDRDMEQQLANAVGGLGVLTDLNSFFNTLQENLESMENLPPEDRRVVLSNPEDLHVIPQAGSVSSAVSVRPLSSPALMYSLRNHRPSYKTRNFVETGSRQRCAAPTSTTLSCCGRAWAASGATARQLPLRSSGR